MRDTFFRHTLEINNEQQRIQIDVNCRNTEKEEQQIKEATEEFFKKVEKLTGWK